MISHEHRCIFIHVPKTAGTSINRFFHPTATFHYQQPDYDRLFGWCPKRQLHMQHATAEQLLETELITEEQWASYFKFAFARNPWDRSYSDYLFVQKFSGINGNFKDYINRTGPFAEILNDTSKDSYLGDHLLQQTDFYTFEGNLKLDYIGRFENFDEHIHIILSKLNISEKFLVKKNAGKNKKNHYSNFYTNSMKKMVDDLYQDDIQTLDYNFDDKRTGLNALKKWL